MPEADINQIGMVLPQIIEALVEAPVELNDVILAKLDIKDGFWRMVCEAEEEWNFDCVLPNHPSIPVEIFMPSTLQMGWAKSPHSSTQCQKQAEVCQQHTPKNQCSPFPNTL